MGVETIDDRQMRRHDTKLDGGWGFDPESGINGAADLPGETSSTVRFPAWREGDAAAEAAASVALVDSVMSPIITDAARKAMAQGVSYAGETPAVPSRPPADFKPFPTMP